MDRAADFARGGSRVKLDSRETRRETLRQIIEMAREDFAAGDFQNPFADPGKPPKSRAGRLWARMMRRFQARGWQQGRLFT